MGILLFTLVGQWHNPLARVSCPHKIDKPNLGTPMRQREKWFPDAKTKLFIKNMSHWGTKSLPNSGEKYFDFDFFCIKCDTLQTFYFYIDSIVFCIILQNKQKNRSWLIIDLRFSHQILFTLGELNSKNNLLLWLCKFNLNYKQIEVFIWVIFFLTAEWMNLNAVSIFYIF